MSDEELIALLEKKAPEELTFEEIELLRAQLAGSTALQQFLIRQMQLDSYLAGALGRIDISADGIIAQASALSAERARTRTKIGLAICAVVACMTGGIAYLAILSDSRAPTSRPQLAADHPDNLAAPTDADRAVAADSERVGDDFSGDSLVGETPDAPDGPREKRPAKVTIANPAPPDPQIPRKSEQPPPVAAQEPVPPTVEGPRPWETPEQLGGPIRPVEEAVFAVGDSPAMKAADVREWFGGVEGQAHQVQDQGKVVAIKGVARLRAPWPEQAVLRISAEQWNNLQIHCWSENHGATIRHFPNYGSQLCWAGYRTERDGGAPLPTRYALTSSDSGRFMRLAQCSSVDLRYENGCVVLSRGLIPLVAVPVPERPTEVYLQGEFGIRRIAMFRCGPLPVLADERPVAAHLQEPAELSWRKVLPKGTNLKELPAGSLQLDSDGQGELAYVGTRLPAGGVQEVIVEVENASPGSGVYLGDDDGTPVFPVRFVQDQRTKHPSVHFLGAKDSQVALGYDWNSMVVPFAANRTWLRLLYTGGVLKCWISVDGQQWGQVWSPWVQDVKGPLTTVGIFNAPVKQPRGIILRQIVVREFDAINGLAPRELLTKAPALSGVSDYSLWLAAVTARQPAGARTESWRRAAAIRSLAAGAPASLAASLARLLIAGAAADDRTPQQQVRLLDQMAMAVNLWETPSGGVEPLDLPRSYQALGVRAARRGELRPYRLVGLSSLASPVWSPQPKDFFQESLARRELLGLAAAGQWPEVRQLCRELSFYNSAALLPLVQWADATATQQLRDRQVGESAVLDYRGRHPLVIELNKEGFNVLAELDAALAGHSFPDACQIISSVRPSNRFGLLPDSKDRDLWMSLSLAVSDAMQRFPELQSTMQQQYGALGRLRVQEAVALGDEGTLAAATVQFFGTIAAAQAHVWLGDRDFSRGDFSQALGHYRQAYQNAEGGLQHQVASRARLANAMMGRSTGQPAVAAVRFGDKEIKAAQFERLIADALKSRKAAATATATPLDGDRSTATPEPAGFTSAAPVKLPWAVGGNPQQVPGPVTQQQVDWIGRQTGWTADRDTVYLSNGFSVCAYRPEQSAFHWNTEIWDKRANTHGWPLVPMRPAVAAGRVVARRATHQGMGLVCLDAATGKVLWQSEIPGNQEVISDPVILGSEVAALSSQQFARNMTLTYVAYDLQTGEVRYQRPIVQFGRSWAEYRTCALTVAGDAIVAATGGSVVCLDLEGNTRWIRRQVWLSAAQLPNWIQCHAVAPLVVKGRVFVVQPGVAAVECLSLGSGQLLWSRPLADVHRVLGLVDQRLIVQTDEGILCLAAPTGDVEWNHDVTQLLEAKLCDGAGGILYVRREKVTDRVFRPQLVWLDGASGRATASCSLEKLTDAEPLLGPFVTHSGELLALWGQGIRNPQRELIKLDRSGEPGPPPPDLGDVDRWIPTLPGNSRSLVEQVLPEWTLLTTPREPLAVVAHQGEQNVLQATATPAAPIMFARYLALPKGASPKLRLRVACQGDDAVRLEAFVGGTVAWGENVKGSETKGAWQQFEIDLSSYAGKSTWVVLGQRHAGGRNPRVFWQKAELVP